MKIEEPQITATTKDLQTALSPDASDIPVPFIFIKSDLRLVIDLQTCIKAQQSEAYAQKVKLSNLKQMAQTVAYIQEHGYNSLEDFHTALDQVSNQTSAARKSLKYTEQQLKDVNEKYILPDSTLHTKTYMQTTVRAAIRINSTKNTGQSFPFMIQLSER